MPTINEKQNKNNSGMFFSALQNEVVFAYYSKSKSMSVGKVCIKRFEFACTTTVSIVLCKCSIMDMQVPPVPNSGPNRIQHALKTHIEATINKQFGEIPPNPFTRRGNTHSRDLPSALALTSAGPLLNSWRRRRACRRKWTATPVVFKLHLYRLHGFQRLTYGQSR